MKINKITPKSNIYPDRLLQLAKPPKKLSMIGASLEELLTMPTVGIVGSRKVTPYGRDVTEEFTASLTRAGICIVSGLALGVDSIAHASALKAKGKTIAVLPSGIKAIYPASHRGLARNILTSGGTLVSEYADDFKPRRESFIERNRIIAALSDALLVTEAAEKSGSLHTANFALELGKPVLAVPGNITSPTSAGTNNLIKMGAVPVTRLDDIFEALGADFASSSQVEAIYGDNPEETIILQLVGQGIGAGSDIFTQSELSSSDYQRHLTMLEIKGRIKPLGNDNWGLS